MTVYHKGRSMYVKELDDIYEYERYRNAKAYLNRQSDPEIRFNGSKENREELYRLARQTGYNNLIEFDRDRQKWHALKGKIPCSYLEAINAIKYVLEAAVEFDQMEFRAARRVPRYPRCAMLRVSDDLYRRIEIPEGTYEDDAIEILRELAVKEDKTCFIDYGEFMRLNVFPNRRAEKILYRPELSVKEDYVSSFITQVSGGVLIPKD